MINEDYCSFEVAKLLKEKGFNEPIRCWYDNTKDFHESGVKMRNSDCINPTIMCPTHQMAMKWLREVYGLHIWVDYSCLDCNKNNPICGISLKLKLMEIIGEELIISLPKMLLNQH